MTNFARTPAHAGHNRLARLLLCAVAALSLLWIVAAPARAGIAMVEGNKLGVQPRGENLGAGEPETFDNVGGNTVLGGTSVYAVYWDPNDVFHEHHEWLTNINHFFQDMGAASGNTATALGALSQYSDRAGHAAVYSTVFKGSYSDLSPYPAAGCTDPKPLERGAITCLTDAQLRAHLESFIALHSLPKGMGSVFYILTPPGVTVCLDGSSTNCSDFAASKGEEETEVANSASYKNSFCSYHGVINPDKAASGDGNTIIYASIPWTAGTQGAAPQQAEGQGVGRYLYAKGEQCQDGGWSFDGVEVKRETPTEPSKEEIEVLEGKKGTGKEREQLERKIRLEGPHNEEPNQAGKEEHGDFAAGLSDLIDNQIWMQQADIVTDPLLDAWHDAGGHEVSNICQNDFGNVVTKEPGEGFLGSSLADEHTEAGTLSNETLAPNRYLLQDLYSAGEGGCAGGVPLGARFTLPNPVNAGEVIDITGLESTIGLLTKENFNAKGESSINYAKFAWNFGDSTEVTGYAPDAPPCEAPFQSPCAGSVLHTYSYGGEYTVTLTVTDAVGYVSAIQHTLKVNGPGAPGAVPGAGGGGAASPGGSSGGAGNVPPPGTPVAKAAVTSRSLQGALRKGLAVSYSVNEQVAGHFEVLISAALAKKLKIGGTPATGLPAGTPAEVVIARSVLVTTKGGRSTVHIRFAKKVAARLKHTRKAGVMLRLVVRNAAATNPQTTTVLSAVTLAG